MVVFGEPRTRRGAIPITAGIALCVGASLGGASEYRPMEFQISIAGDTVVYEGDLSTAGNAELFSRVAGAEEAITTLHVTSRGGDVKAGIELGSWIHDHGLNVHVSRLCGSSCANYVFAAGRKKTLEGNALVVWHGGALQEGLTDVPACVEGEWFHEYFGCDAEAMRAEMSSKLESLQKSEAAFYRKIGVDQRITILGQLPEYACDTEGVTRGWYYSIADLRLLGVENVEVAGGVWQPEPPDGAKVCRVEVGQLPRVGE